MSFVLERPHARCELSVLTRVVISGIPINFRLSLVPGKGPFSNSIWVIYINTYTDVHTRILYKNQHLKTPPFDSWAKRRSSSFCFCFKIVFMTLAFASVLCRRSRLPRKTSSTWPTWVGHLIQCYFPENWHGTRKTAL